MIYDPNLGPASLLAETQRLAGRMNGRFFHDFVVKLDDGFAENFEDGRATLGQVIVATSPFGLSDRSLRAEPAIALEALQQRIQGSGADVVAMLSQLAQYPLSNDGMFGGMVEDVYFPEAQQDFAREKFSVKTGHGEG
jgi:hypothetical protein